MTSEEHKALGIKYFNKTWDYIDNPHRSEYDNFEMIHYAHASRLHWTLSGAPMLNIVRGEWLISHVYSMLGHGEAALVHAQFCLDQTLLHNIKDFDVVFAYEAMARAHQALGNTDESYTYLSKGYKLLTEVSDSGDRKYCEEQLDDIKNNIK